MQPQILTLAGLQMPSSASSGVGLGGVPVEAPPRQHSQLDQAQRSAFTADQSAPGVTSWAPKTSASAGGTSLGGSILNSIQPQPSAHSVASEALAASSPRGQNQVNPGSSHSNFGQSPMVIPSPNQVSCLAALGWAAEGSNPHETLGVMGAGGARWLL